MVNRSGYALVLGRQPQGKGGASKMLIPLPLPGFLPQSPTFLLPQPPLGYDAALHVLTMLHRTVLKKSCTGNRGKISSRLVPHKRGERISSLLRSLPSQRGCRSHSVEGHWVCPWGCLSKTAVKRSCAEPTKPNPHKNNKGGRDMKKGL